MNVTELFELVSDIIRQNNSIFTPYQVEVNNFFLKELKKLVELNEADPVVNITRATILFEGFYRHLPEGDFKFLMAKIRSQRWEQHFGTPTVLFMLSYKQQIDDAHQLFDSIESLPECMPWMELQNNHHSKNDVKNQVIVDPNSISRIEAPPQREITGFFTKTHNPFGGFTTTPCDPVSQKFIEHAAETASNGGKVLEIGAAFGAATLAAIAKGATVYCNDIDASNLAVVRQRYLETSSMEDADLITGDDSKLILVPGALPHELTGLPKKFFDAILICRVLHFFTGAKIEESLALISSLLAPSGKIYIVCETPFLKNWQRFIPEFNRRVESGVDWPGEITNPAEFESSGRAASLPKFVHWITKEVLERSLLRTGFIVENADYIDRSGQFPEDLLLPDIRKESVGAIGINR